MTFETTVLTVPSYLSSRQRQSLIEAAKIGGLINVSLINETAAIAYCYGLQWMRKLATNP